jgi:hypothetical protein
VGHDPSRPARPWSRHAPAGRAIGAHPCARSFQLRAGRNDADEQGFFARFGFAVERVEADGFGGGYDLVEMELSL